VVCGDVAPDEPPNQMRWLREKPVQVSVISEILKRQSTGNHFYPRLKCKLRRLLPDYRVVVFDKGDARIVIADGKRFLKDERALMALRQLEENVFGG